MNWFDTSGLTSLAKSALKEAQKTIDKALDIQDESDEESKNNTPPQIDAKASPGSSNQSNKDFLSSWGLTTSGESRKDEPVKEQPVVTESPSKSNPQSMWGSFAGSFFEQSKQNEGDSTIVQPPKAKSMDLIADNNYDSSDDLFSKSQLVMSEGESFQLKNAVSKDNSKNERRSSSRSNRLSLVSSRNSSDSVEVLSQSLKTTPDSEPASINSVSHSSSIGPKPNSESVEILPDSQTSPSSIECLGFDTPSILSPSEDISNKKSTPIGERTEKNETADSVSLVADDDEDTMSYNSISECTAPTVLDTDEKPYSPFQKQSKSEFQRKGLEILNLDQPLVPQKMQISENSSNDGSWSDRTLNADNESMTLENTIDDLKKEGELEDTLIEEKLSDSSSFYNVNVSTDMVKSESSAFVNVEKQQCSSVENLDSLQKDCCSKERVSPISSDSKSDLVKIGSDRTSGHTSGDEIETATSSDIEIIPSPNGDNGHGYRSSPLKFALKNAKLDGNTSPNLVDLVLGKSLATKVRGHYRELSEASIQSNTSDESQGSENEKLMRRLSEMAEILDARENRLMEVSRNNAELAETNSSLKSQMESLMAKHEGGDISTITEDYTQRMSALEKKFQQAIREKDQFRKQLDGIRSDSARKLSSELENTLKEKEEVIAQLQEEGEKLSRQQLQHSNIIKKLRAKEKDNEQVIKNLRDKIAEQTAELDRLKRSIAAKEEVEVNQIEAVYRLTTANKKLETELLETRSKLEDCSQKCETALASLAACSRELGEAQRAEQELRRGARGRGELQREKALAESERQRLETLVQQLRAEIVNEERRFSSREEALRRELAEARETCASLEARAEAEASFACDSGAGAGAQASNAGALLSQLASLQRSALEREQARAAQLQQLVRQIAESETSLAKAAERERLAREEAQALRTRLDLHEDALRDERARLQEATARCQDFADKTHYLEAELDSKSRELEALRETLRFQLGELQMRLSETEDQLTLERSALEAEKKRGAILQERAGRADESPPHSIASDSLSSSAWPPEESCLAQYLALSACEQRLGAARSAADAGARLRADRSAAQARVAALTLRLQDFQALQEQYDALLQMYGEKEEQLAELRLDLQDVTQLYKQQLQHLGER